MSAVDEAVTELYRDEEIASLAFSLTGSVAGAETLVRASVARAVARGWWLRRGLQARVRHAMVRLACAELSAADTAPACPGCRACPGRRRHGARSGRRRGICRHRPCERCEPLRPTW
ncbi:hypothetical protein [Demequina litorisediminis]|uniref:hypothetical protein n=1 Tax=Demequina litorisediminis TaxID=1849022 RepID=UPI0024E0BCEE|nr:hypothetical protein [Demequina litorisediminis]